MVKLNKRPMPPKPISSEMDYRNDLNFSAIAEDCYSKCYICEYKATTFNVEHRIPHRGDESIKYDWQNLFLACGHCNNTKLDCYDNIINPTQCDPEDCIALSLTTDTLVENVVVEALTDDESVLQTVDLLGVVYNGGKTAIKKIRKH